MDEHPERSEDEDEPQRDEEREREEDTDAALEDTFPASDPPAQSAPGSGS